MTGGSTEDSIIRAPGISHYLWAASLCFGVMMCGDMSIWALVQIK
jgi:hypothetical protein